MRSVKSGTAILRHASSGVLCLSLASEFGRVTRIQVLDARGRVVRAMSPATAETDGGHVRLPTAGLGAGMYLVHVVGVKSKSTFGPAWVD